MTRAIQAPTDRGLFDENGRLLLEWTRFFKGLEKQPTAALADLPSNASTADIVTRVNALAAILRTNKLLSQ
jgi:hypothetical protein